MEADIDPSEGAEGVLAAWGTSNTGFVFYLQAGEVVFDYNLFGTHHVVRAAAPSAGPTTVSVDFDRTESGADVTVTGESTSTDTVPWVLRFIGMSGMDVGRDAGSPVGLGYEGPFPFAGSFTELRFEVTDELSPQEIFRLDRARVRRELTQQ